jgi:hypothetical protein
MQDKRKRYSGGAVDQLMDRLKNIRFYKVFGEKCNILSHGSVCYLIRCITRFQLLSFKMKIFLIFLAAILSIPSFGQSKDGFKKEEARDMVAICNSFTFLELYKSDNEILPADYKKIYTSRVFGMDNKYQIYKNGHIAVINLRGSTANKLSWLENINSAMIPAKGVIKTSGDKFEYCFAKNPNAAVHSGFALGMAFLYKDILLQINNLNKEGIHHIIITGHSQGGALANMLRAFLENLSHDEISKKNKFKTYAFAAPMVGNKEFSEEYNNRYALNGSSFNIVIPGDLVPTFPLNYNDTSYIAKNLKTLLFERESFNLTKAATDGLAILLEKKILKSVGFVGSSASGQISRDLGEVVMPPYVDDINYHTLNTRVEINPVAYPKILKDSTILKNDSLMTVYKRGNDGTFLNKELYEKEPWNYQHKPYSYYTSILKSYFPHDYNALRRKYLPENL